MSDERLDDFQVQRELANMMSQTLLYATGRDYFTTPDQLQRLYNPISGRSRQLPPYFLQIETIGNQLDAGQSASLSLQMALAACAGDQAHEVVFLVINTGSRNRVYLGVRHPAGIANHFMDAFTNFFSWGHPGSRLTALDPRLDGYDEQVLNPLRRMRFGTCITGIPSAKLAGGSSLVSCLDGLLTSSSRKPFAYVVVAKPMLPADINDVLCRCRNLIGDAHQLAKTSITRGLTESYSVAESKTSATQRTQSQNKAESESLLGMGTILGGLMLAFPPAGLAASIAYLGVGAALPFLAQSTSRSTSTGESSSQTESRSLTETSGTSRSMQAGKEIINAHVQAAERHLERYADRFSSSRAIGLWNAEVYCLSESPDFPGSMGAQMQAVLNGTESSLEPVRWHKMDGLMSASSFRDGRFACESASVQFGLPGNRLTHPLGRQYEGLGTPLTTSELTHLLNMPRREMPGLRMVSTASFSLNGPEINQEPGIQIGHLIDCGKETSLPYVLPFHSLAKHTLLAGINGSGKSTTCRTILRSVTEAKIPFLVIEPAKDEYVEWAMALNGEMAKDDPRRIAVYIPGVDRWRGNTVSDTLALNPLEVVWLSPDHEPQVIAHIDSLKAILGGSLPMQDILPVVLEELLYDTYARHASQWLDGNPDYGTANFPTLSSLEAGIQPLINAKSYEPRFRMQLIEALRTRIGSLSRQGWKGSLFNPKPETFTNWSNLFDRPTVINLSHLKDPRDKAFTMALILQFLYEYRTAQADLGTLSMNAGFLRHLTVVEEAHRVMARPPMSQVGEANPQAIASQLFSDLLSEIRAYGEGFLIVEQVPERLIADAIKNTNLKIVHRLVAKDDREVMAGSMNLTAPQTAMISRLRPGQAVFCGDGDDSACMVSINLHSV